MEINEILKNTYNGKGLCDPQILIELNKLDECMLEFYKSDSVCHMKLKYTLDKLRTQINIQNKINQLKIDFDYEIEIFKSKGNIIDNNVLDKLYRIINNMVINNGTIDSYMINDIMANHISSLELHSFKYSYINNIGLNILTTEFTNNFIMSLTGLKILGIMSNDSYLYNILKYNDISLISKDPTNNIESIKKYKDAEVILLPFITSDDKCYDTLLTVEKYNTDCVIIMYGNINAWKYSLNYINTKMDHIECTENLLNSEFCGFPNMKDSISILSFK